MTNVQRNNKPLAERPLKTSQATGASLATLGFAKSIPLMHGSQGCGAFAKVYLIQHFREPMPIQNTAVDQIAAVMGSDSNIQDALQLLQQQHNPDLITVLSTGLTEMQGSDIARNVREFEQHHQNKTSIAAVPCPDFVGSLQTGFANTLDSIIKRCLADITAHKTYFDQINILCSSALTPADVELIKQYCEFFDLQAIIAPDLSTSLDGHLDTELFSPTSTGGTTIEDVRQMPNSAATICIGESVFKTGEWFEKTYEKKSHYFSHLMGLEQTDAFVQLLSDLSGRPIPQKLLRARKRLQDTLLDTHFVLTDEAIGIAQESDAILGFSALCSEVGCQLPIAITATNSEQLPSTSVEHITVGDHSDLDPYLPTLRLVIGNTHCAEFIEPDVPVLRAGYPCHDRYGNSDVLFAGYEGARATLNAMANILSTHAEPELTPFVSPYAFSSQAL
jgi:nitrogenase molybdenum-iron protein NifN